MRRLSFFFAVALVGCGGSGVHRDGQDMSVAVRDLGLPSGADGGGTADLDFPDDACIGGWISRPVFGTNGRGQDNPVDIAIDGQNIVHGVFYEPTADDGRDGPLMHVTDAPGAVATAISTRTLAGGVIAAGSDGSLHVAAWEPATSQMYDFSTKDWRSGAWQESAVGPGIPTDIVVDGGGAVHIAFASTDPNKRMIGYATNRSGAWVATLLRSGAVAELAVDGSGYAHIASTAQVCCETDYTTNRSGAWVTEIVTPWLGSSNPAGIFIDGNGQPHILANGRHAWRTPSSWMGEAMPGPPDQTDLASSIAATMDSHHVLHVAWQEKTPGLPTIRYVTNRSGVWTSSSTNFNFDDSTFIIDFGPPALATDGLDRPHMFPNVSFLNRAPGAWMFYWEVQTCP